MQKQNRADQIIIVTAIIILLLAAGSFYFDGWMWGGRRDRGARIGTIVARNGDVRARFDGDVRWQRAAGGQDLIYDDAIYAGNGSSARLQFGESEMTVSENSLVVLRRDQNIDFMRLAYGNLYGRIAQDQKIVIDTGDGKPIELTASSNAQVDRKSVV